MSRSRWLLLAGVVALAVFLFVYDLPQQNRQEKREARARRLMVFEVADVDTVRVQRPDGRILLVHDADGGWELRQPVEERAVPERVNAWLENLVRAKRFRVLERSLADSLWASYGLERGGPLRASIEVISRHGRSQSLMVGKRNPVTDLCYVRRGGSSALELAEGGVYDLVWTPANAYRDHDLFAVADSSINLLEVGAGRMHYRALRDGRGLWYLDRVGGQRLRRQEMEGLAYDLASARIREFTRDDVADGEWFGYGLHEPFADIRFSTTRGEEHRVRLGNEADRELLFARRDEEHSLLILTSQLLAQAERPLADLIDRNPLDLNFSRLDSVRIDWENGTSITLRREGREWAADVPGPRGSEPPTNLSVSIDNALRGLEGFQPTGTAIVAPAQSVKEYFQRQPVHCRLISAGRSVDLRLGWTASSQEHWLQIDDRREIYRVDRDLFLRLRALFVNAQLLQI